MSITPSKQTSVYRQVDAIMKRKIYTAETSTGNNGQLQCAYTTSLVPHRHKTILHGRRIQEPKYYGIICQTTLTLYDPGGGGALKAPPPPPIFCPHAFNFGATILCVGDFSQKIV